MVLCLLQCSDLLHFEKGLLFIINNESHVFFFFIVESGIQRQDSA